MKLDLKLIPSQMTFMRHFDDLEYAFLAGVGTGKSFVGALYVVSRVLKGEKWFAGSQQWGTTKNVQFKAITDLLDMAGLKEDTDYAYNKSELIITFKGSKGIIKGVASMAKNAVTGYTKFNGAWFDESFLWDEDSKNYVMGRCRNCFDNDGNLTDARFRYTGTPPLEPSGWYYGWLCKHPNSYVQASTEESIGKYNAPSYLEQQIEAYGGRNSPLCRIQVFGEMPTAESSLSIFNREHHPVQIPISMGIDVGGGEGGDSAYFFITNGVDILEEFETNTYTQRELVAKAMDLSDKWKVTQRRVDVTGGFGTYLVEALNDASYPTEGINFGQKARDDKYANARAEMYFNLASRWNDDWGDKCKLERYATIFSTNATGKLKLIEKDAIKKVLGHSPDALDAMALACYTDEGGNINEEQLGIALSLFDI